jgi:hypothetical protein
MNRLTLVLAVTLALVACSKKEDAPAGGAAAKAADKPADKPAEPAGGGAVKTNPKDLFSDFTRPGVDGLELMNKYEKGATFTGTIKTVGQEESGKPVIMMDVDGKNMISLDFTDPTKVKGAKVGDSLTVTCKIGGASGALMMVLDCVTK